MKPNDIFSISRQRYLLSRAIKLANDRYSATLNIHVDSPINQLDIVAHADSFLKSTRDIYNQLYERSEENSDKIKPLLSEISQSIKRFIDKYPLDVYDWTKVRDLAEIAREECFSNLSAIEKQKKTSKNPNGTWARQQDYNNLIRILYRLDDVICRENQTLYNERVAILQGDGGIGKTHLLCDYASGRLNSNLPTFLFLSDDLSGRDPVIAIAKRLGFKSKKTFLKELRAFTLQQNNQTCFIVDAINENSAMAWKQILDLLQVPKVSVILSIRNGFEQVTKVKDWKIPRVWHHGFAEGKLEWEAMQKYFRHYNLSDIPDTPVLYEEFRNPLFLKVFCESYEGTSIGKKPRGHIMTNIFEQYVVEKTKIINKDLGVHLGKKDIWEGVVKPMSEYLGSHGVKLVIPSGQLYNL